MREVDLLTRLLLDCVDLVAVLECAPESSERFCVRLRIE